MLRELSKVLAMTRIMSLAFLTAGVGLALASPASAAPIGSLPDDLVTPTSAASPVGYYGGGYNDYDSDDYYGDSYRPQYRHYYRRHHYRPYFAYSYPRYQSYYHYPRPYKHRYYGGQRYYDGY
jgi:hypothetical protein